MNLMLLLSHGVIVVLAYVNLHVHFCYH